MFIVGILLMVGDRTPFVLPFKGRKPDRKIVSVISVFKGTVKPLLYKQ
ncbi:hypothetical protein KLEB303S_gp55 [Bacillus phage vB_BceS_KLEB30-3S]|nr:hypothetical protein KLEB303S_gp55 [Bacillus phage vB_BceS_KLEB30-3S]